MTNGHSLKQLKQFKSVHLFVLFATLNFALLSNFANGQITQKYPLGAKLLPLPNGDMNIYFMQNGGISCWD